MQSYDLFPNPILISPNPHLFDLPSMADPVSSPIHPNPTPPETNGDTQKPETNPSEDQSNKELETQITSSRQNSNSVNNVIFRRERPTRACTTRPTKYVDPPLIERRQRPAKRYKVEKEVVEEIEEENEEEQEEEGVPKEQCSKIVTPLVNEPTLEQMPRWRLRSMWELASILHFFNVFRPLLNIKIEFSAEELESALLTPNATLGDIHIPLLKAIPPITRMACSRDTWVTVLCRKLRDWWHWVAEGELPIVASHGAEIETYRNLDPGVRVVILKALCDIRVEQDDIRSYIDNSLKRGVHLSAFRKQRIGGNSQGISYWYEDDEVIGHRLYREIKKVEVKTGKTKGSLVMPSTSYEWETAATNLDEFLDVSEKLFMSGNRTEASLGKKLKNDMLPEIEKIYKRKEKLMKKQHREALLLNTFVTMDGLMAGRSLRDRKPVTYTFDNFDRSINEAIKITKRKQPSPEPSVRKEASTSAPSTNGRWNAPSQATLDVSSSPPSPADYDDMDDDHKSGPLDRSNRRRQRPQRYSEREFVEAISDEAGFDSDDDIVGEAVYDDEYLRQRKYRKKLTSSSEGEGDEEYHWSEENGEDEVEEEEDEEEDSLSNISEDSDRPRRSFKRPETRKGGSKLRSVQAGLRRSKRSTRPRVNYQQYEFSDSENELTKPGRENVSESPRRNFRQYELSGSEDELTRPGKENAEDLIEGRDSEGSEDQQRGLEQPTSMVVESEPLIGLEPAYQDGPKLEPNHGADGFGKIGFLDLNELAPGSGFDDGPSALLKDDIKSE